VNYVTGLKDISNIMTDETEFTIFFRINGVSYPRTISELKTLIMEEEKLKRIKKSAD